jgi:hypothetical protein
MKTPVTILVSALLWSALVLPATQGATSDPRPIPAAAHRRLIRNPQSALRNPDLDFDRDVRPILADNCFPCHGFDANKRAAGLRLDLAEGARAVLPTGHRAVVPRDPSRSELVRRVAARTMPPAASRKQLTAAQIATLKRWVAEGAAYSTHWAFVPPRRPALPAVRDAKWCRNPIDRFILARLEKEGLKPSPEADRPTLIRRVTLDLTGLPPTPAEVDAFLADRAPNAYEKVVDRLLASPRYGERMAWEWLDAARYADTNGYQGDNVRTMWPWRDWVVRALNANMPFDQFVVEQIAGDLLERPTLDQRIATGFNRNHMLNGEGGRIPEESRVDYVVDRTDTTATVFLGLTLGCSRCHDHKFDPFLQKEYYQLSAYFNNLPETGSVDRGGNANPVLPLPTPEQSTQIAVLQAKVQALQASMAALTADSPERAGVQKQLDEARKALQGVQNGVLVTMVMEERPQPRDTFVLIRGAYDRPAEKVAPGTPASLPPLPKDAPPNRLALARWLVDPANPLTGRVAVNRYWQLFFGTGIVKTAEDFGTQGERPTHPALLDYLASEFSGVGASVAGDGERERQRDRGRGAARGSSLSPSLPPAISPSSTAWDVKAIHRLIVTSSTYRQSSHHTPRPAARRAPNPQSAIRNPQLEDPENRLLARGPRFRLSSAQLRDQALAVSGLLVEKLGGPSVKPYQPAGVWEDATFGQIRYEQDHGEALYRRTLYTFWRRIVAPTELFDAASRQTCTVRQARTNTPLHALTTLNDVTYVEAARAFAQRVLQTGGAADSARLDGAYRLAAARLPTPAERRLLLARLARLRAHYAGDTAAAKALLSAGESARDEKLDPTEHAAWTALCNLILNLDEVITRE